MAVLHSRARSCRLGRTGRVLALVALAACRQATGREPDPAANDPDEVSAATPLAIVGVNLVPMTSNITLANQTIVVRDGAIATIGPTASTPVPAEATVLDGAGRWVMPALIDMHAHLSSADLDAYVAAGIGTIRNMWGTPGVAAMIRDIEGGTRVGPTIMSASQGVDGEPPQWPLTLVVTAPADARRVVQSQVDAGWSWLKVYSRLTPAVFDSVMVAARELGIRPIGHVPLAVDVHHAIAEGMLSIEHFTGYDRAVSRSGRSGTWAWIDADPSRFAALAQETARAGVWNCPTMAIYAELSRRQHSSGDRATITANRRRFVLELHRAGAKLLVGTDAGIDVVAPGTSIHDELSEFVAAGLTPYEALQGATTSAAEFLGRGDIGRVAEGMRADLVLLRRNPLSDIRHARELDGIVLRGAWRSLR